jgi:4-amino-4-deoxy-L-arabinose transferase-like glycosyltransferase
VPALGAAHRPGEWARTIPWFAFPSLPLACLTLWRARREATSTSGAAVQFCVLASGVVMAVLVVSASARDNYALPLLAPLSILAAPAVSTLPARLDKWWAAGAGIAFGLWAAAAWAVLIAVLLSDDASHALSRALPLDFSRSTIDAAATASALALTALLVAVAAFHRRPGRGLVAWVAGLALCWGLLMSLWLPWLDATKSYRGMFVSMRGAMPVARCVASRGMGESERAMLHYVLHIDTRRSELDPQAAAACDLLLVQGFAASPPPVAASPRWRRLWDGARPRDSRERFWLFAAS